MKTRTEGGVSGGQLRSKIWWPGLGEEAVEMERRNDTSDSADVLNIEVGGVLQVF